MVRWGIEAWLCGLFPMWEACLLGSMGGMTNLHASQHAGHGVRPVDPELDEPCRLAPDPAGGAPAATAPGDVGPMATAAATAVFRPDQVGALTAGAVDPDRGASSTVVLISRSSPTSRGMSSPR